ncbi:MAG: DEAD/DEAH box helicase [Candidatus Obscuribacterales bacterium]|jgi:superfamily II DNA/RNA helicase
MLEAFANRDEDYYISLVGELFSKLDVKDEQPSDWAQLGNAFLQFSVETTDTQLAKSGISRADATLFAAAAFYFGCYPASACLSMRRWPQFLSEQSIRSACFDFLARPRILRSQFAIDAREFVLTGNFDMLSRLIDEIHKKEQAAITDGPEEWITCKLLVKLIEGFRLSNLRTVLPLGHLDFWNPLVKLFIERENSTWEFFPSQIEAIGRGLLSSKESFSLQMPTGAGKTTLCETLLYWHLKSYSDEVAILVVPYRSLASELRGGLVQDMNKLGLPARCVYGGTIPTSDENRDLDNLRALIATPESLTGLLGAEPAFVQRIGLVICDEGHLLDSHGRGVGLELLLARLKARREKPTRFVFMSAIVPNIEEINEWLGGSESTVVRSDYRPALAEFAVLRAIGSGANTLVALDMHPHEPQERQFTIDNFLTRNDFTYLNRATNRINVQNFTSAKAQVIACALKALPLGVTAIFATNKNGPQGVFGIADSLIQQLENDLPLPKPITFAKQENLQLVIAYFVDEYGSEWNGTKCLQHGIVLHHGDIPQEAREVIERLIRKRQIGLIICTGTLAEGVNLPIRTLLLYSVRRHDSGLAQNMLSRDIKNLVGRAGRAGASTKGLVICASWDQWQHVKPVAMQATGEPVKGALVVLINRITESLVANHLVLTNELMESTTEVYPLIDGVDSTLIELLADEIGEEEFVTLAMEIALETFAARQLTPESVENLRSVFALRAQRLVSLRADGKIAWVRDTGAKARLIDSVELSLLPLLDDWSSNIDSLSNELQNIIFSWAWLHTDLQNEVKKSFRLDNEDSVETVKSSFFEIAGLWMAGLQFKEIAFQTNLSINTVLAVYSRGINYALQTLVEQGIALLSKRLEADGIILAEGILNFPEHLKFGCPTVSARILAASGVRHRKACVELGAYLEQSTFSKTQSELKRISSASMTQFEAEWRSILGDLIYQSSLTDLAPS